METINGIRAGVGIGNGEDSYVVGVNAVQDALDQLGDKEPDLLLVFSSVKYDQEKILSGARSVAPKALLVGSSTSGEIVTMGPLKEHSLVVMAIKSPKIKYYAGVGENIAASLPDVAGCVGGERRGHGARSVKFSGGTFSGSGRSFRRRFCI